MSPSTMLNSFEFVNCFTCSISPKDVNYVVCFIISFACDMLSNFLCYPYTFCAMETFYVQDKPQLCSINLIVESFLFGIDTKVLHIKNVVSEMQGTSIPN